MSISVWVAFFALAVSTAPQVTPATAADPIEAASQSNEVARVEIERILNADNVDVRRRSSRAIVAHMRAIPRGQAPADFWNAYQRHITAWERFAIAEEAYRTPSRGNPAMHERAIVQLGGADRAVNATFHEVNRIAARYGASIPAPAAPPFPQLR